MSPKLSDEDCDAIRHDFDDAVNMSPSELERWLRTDESKEVGWPKDDGGGESVGHDSGRRIVTIKRKNKDELTDADLEHARKVVGYVHRLVEQAAPTRTPSPRAGATRS